MHDTVSQAIDMDASEDDVTMLIRELDINKGMGLDGIPPRFYKRTVATIVIPLTIIFRTSLTTQVFLDAWKLALTTPILKILT